TLSLHDALPIYGQREDREDHAELPVGFVRARAHLELGPHPRAAVAVRLRVLALEVAGERGELVPALLQRDAALEAAAHDQPAIVAVLEEILVRAGGKAASHGQRHVEVGRSEERRVGKEWR